MYTPRLPGLRWLAAPACAALLVVLSLQPAAASKVHSDELIHSALQLDADTRNGAAVFNRNCASCHGAAALGDEKNGVPALAAQRQSYLVKQLADFSEHERESRIMHGVVAQKEIARPQVWIDVATFLSNLAPLTRPVAGNGKQLELGEAIFQDQCASCHEDDARGDDDGFVPSLRNQHYFYLVKQIRSIATWHRANMEEDLIRFLGSLPEDETLAVADYLARLRTPVRDRAVMQDNGTLKDAGDATPPKPPGDG